VGLPVPDRVIRAINFYSSGTSYNTTPDLPGQIREAFRSRMTIETAKVVLMARNRSSDREASRS
jgi:AmiR/NasT family two-component response regulator